MSKLAIEIGKTYRARRGRKLYTVLGALDDAGVVYEIRTTLRDTQERLVLTEQELRDQARLKGPIEQAVVYLSPSQIRTFRGCKRQWAWQHIDSEIEPPKPAQAFGTDTHGVLETYLKRCIWTGPADAIAVAKQGAHLLPQSSPDRSLKIEYPFEIMIFDGQAKIIGVIDLLDPPGKDPTCEVIDHKTTADAQYIMTPEKLARDVQATVYSVWAMEAYQIKEVKTSWRYYIGKKNKTKSADEAMRPRIPGGFRVVSRIKKLDEVKLHWRGILETAKEMTALSNNLNIGAADIPGNEFVCQDYGGCSFRHLCEKLKMRQNLNDNNGEAKMTTRNFWDALKDQEATPEAPKAPEAQEHPAVTAKRSEKQHAEEFQKTWRIAPPATPAILEKPESFAAPPAEQLTIPSPAAVLQTSKPHTVETLQQNPVNPPPMEQMELPKILQDAQTPTIPQTWIDRLDKGHKARSKKEEEWRMNTTLQQAKALKRAQISADQSPEGTYEVPEKMQEQAQARARELAQQEMAKIKAAEGTEDQEEATTSAVSTDPTPAPVRVKADTKAVADYNYHTTAGPTQSRLILLVDCLPAKGRQATMLSTALAPLKAAVEKKHGVAFWSLLSYREGDSFLAAYLRTAWQQEKPSGAFLVDSRSAEWRACGDVLMALADVVIRGV
jgi:hypothetical protein